MTIEYKYDVLHRDGSWGRLGSDAITDLEEAKEMLMHLRDSYPRGTFRLVKVEHTETVLED